MLLSRLHTLCTIIYLLLLSVASLQEVLIEESSSIESLHAPTGGSVELPCDVTPALPDDSMALVIWYKQGHDQPIYSLDTREGVTSHYSDPSTLGARASFRSHTQPAVLVITRLRAEDSGQYRCRVDFIRSQTKNTRLNLTVLIPPERLMILNHRGDEVHGGVLGPYDEGSDVNLTCVAVGGNPPARVSWWKSHALMANSETRATVHFTLTRSDYGTNVTCQAVTDPSIVPLSETLTVDVNLRLLWIRLLGGKRPLVAGQATELICQAVGARPKPNISWWKGGVRLKTVRESVSTDGNVTSSILTFTPSIDDAGRVVSCRAVQTTLPHSTHEDGWKLEIQHLPVVKLELGASLDPDKVVEGSDVYLDCAVKANPWHTHVYFTHNGAMVKPGPGVLVANQSLVLQRVSRRAAGAYVCTARSALGEGASDPLLLDVKYGPTCKSQQTSVVRAARGEVVHITCHLDANPLEPMSYQWWFNSTSHSQHDLTAPTANTHSAQGRFAYTVSSSADYGWVQCAGTNAVGRQEAACVFSVLPAEKPSPVRGCEITNVTYECVSVACAAGHDGGVRQWFSVQVWDAATGGLLRNASGPEPIFVVRGLGGGGALRVAVRAHNAKGTSDAVTLTTSLLQHPQRHTARVPVKVELTTLLVSVLCTASVIVAGIVVVAVVACCRYCNKKDGTKDKLKRKQQQTTDEPVTTTDGCGSRDSLEKNPDIIPIQSRVSDTCSSKSSATDYSAIKPLISRNNMDPGNGHVNCERFYEHDPFSQYVQARPTDFRRQYQPYLQMPNLGPSIQNFGPNMGHISNVGPNECGVPYDKVYEDWLKYKNALPLNTTGLLPVEQLLPPELCPPPPLYASPRPLQLVPMPDPDRRQGALQHVQRTGSPVRLHADTTSAYYSKELLDRTSNTLPHKKSTAIRHEITDNPQNAKEMNESDENGGRS